jgi:hypothetical protein
MKGLLVRIIIYTSFFFVGVALSRALTPSPPPPPVYNEDSAYFEGCVAGLMTAALFERRAYVYGRSQRQRCTNL